MDAETISKRYIAECKKDMEMMNVKPATKNPQATQEIGGMIEMINTLIEKGHAYVAADGTVYFRTKSFKEYGKLSHKNLDDLQSGFREIKVTGEEGKEDPTDFFFYFSIVRGGGGAARGGGGWGGVFLWKPKKEGERAVFWESPWCQGRPGWHIECSEMSKKYLGESIDIHAGGEDLIFPHHENEIAQSECANGKTFANYWMHNAFLNIDNRKMSKSLGNFFTVREISEKYDFAGSASLHAERPVSQPAQFQRGFDGSFEKQLRAHPHCGRASGRLPESSERGRDDGRGEAESGSSRGVGSEVRDGDGR